MIMYAQFILVRGEFRPNESLAATEAVSRYLYRDARIVSVVENAERFEVVVRCESYVSDSAAKLLAGNVRDRLISGVYYARVYDTADRVFEALMTA